MTQSYNMMFKLYKEQGRLNLTAMRKAFDFMHYDYERHTVSPELEFCIDVCAEMDSCIGSLIRRFGDLCQGEGGEDALTVAAGDAIRVVDAVWKSQNRVAEVLKWTRSASKVAIKYATSCMQLRWRNNLRKDQRFREMVVSVCKDHNIDAHMYHDHFDDFILTMEPVQYITHEAIERAVQLVVSKRKE